MRFRGAFALIVATLLVAAAPAGATTIEVETDGDDFGTGPSSCALREAVEAARTNQAFGGCPKGSKTKRDTVQLIGDAVLTIGGDTATNADGDLDYDGGGKLTILGAEFPQPNPPTIVQNFSDRILEITHQKGVKVVGVEMEGGGSVNSGGAVRASQGATVTLDAVRLHDNISELRGGAVACEGCRSLRLEGAFNIDDNLVQGAASAAGGGVWSNAPTVIDGVDGGILSFDNARMTGNSANPTGDTVSQGGAIFAGDDLTISHTYIFDNEALDNGFGGGIALSQATGGDARLKVSRSTLEENVAASSGGGIYAEGADRVLDLRRSLIVDNDSTGSDSSGSAFSAGVHLFEGGGKIADSVIDGNVATATAAGDTAAGGGIFMSTVDPDPPTLELARTSVTRNAVAVGTANQRGGGLVIQGRLEAVNATISENTAPAAGADGGGLRLEASGISGSPSGRLDFTTLKANSAGTGAADGDGLMTEGPLKVRASVIDQPGDGCSADAGLITSLGFSVEDDTDPDCEIDAATDSHDPDFLLSLDENGSPAVGADPGGLFGVEPLTHAFTNSASAALDIVPPSNCKADGKELKADARGAPRPVGDGCDAGATERIACLGAFAVGDGAYIGTNRADEVFVGASVVLARGGDDFVSGGTGDDSVCAGKGDDLVQPGADNDEIAGGSGIDTINYNNAMAGGLVIDLATALATGPTIGNDTFTSIENAQGSEDDDEVLGDDKANRLIGGGNLDTIRGRGGIDVIDAKDNEADIEINCGPGNNSKEKAKIDVGLDPDPISC